jgi:hypothetical protein
MKHPLSAPIVILAGAIVLAVVVGALLFRYDVRGSGNIRYDRWSGEVQVITDGEWKSFAGQ